jgi:hypothetical protein
MELRIKTNNTETKNVQTAQVINPAPAKKSGASRVKSEERRVKSVPVTSHLSPVISNRFTLVTYPTKSGGTAYKIFGFSDKESAEAVAAKCSKTVGVRWAWGDNGDKRYCLCLGQRYGDVSKALCDALNGGNKTAIDKACAASCGVYDKAVADAKAEKEAKQVAAAATANDNANDNPEPLTENHAAGSSEPFYSAKDVAEMLQAILAGGDIPAEVEQYMKVAA